MTRQQNLILALTFAGTLICGIFAALAFGHDAANAAVGWAVAAVIFGGTFKICAQDFGVWHV
jgi:hypothetical protein